MKIIDERGSLFGKINIIDLFVVILILSVIPMVMWGNRLASHPKSLPKETKETIEVKIKLNAIIPELAEVIKEGDVEEDKSGIVGRIVKIISNEPQKILSMGENIESGYREIRLLLELSCVVGEGTIKYGNNVLRIGAGLTFTTDLYTVGGVIIGIERRK